jgi:hypothetical protein
MASRRKIDLHMHTTVSDGSDAPEEIIARVSAAGIGLFSVTDHDAVKGCRVIRRALRPGDPAFLCGAEFSCKDEQGKYHILGYRYDPDSPAISRLIDHGHSLRMQKVRARLDFIRTEFGFAFPEEEIRTLLAMDNPGKPHIGNLMVKYGYAKSKEDAIRNYIDRLRFGSEYVRPEEAIAGILGGGGIPILAHPFFGDGDQLIVGEAMEARLVRLMDFGLQGVEAFYSGFSPKLIIEMLGYADRYDLCVTAGSDYHGKNKLIELGDTGLVTDGDAVRGLDKFLAAVRD